MAKRILIADDSVTIQRAFAMVFTGQDVAVLAARSLDEALTIARREKPAVVIADVAFGNRTGYELCGAIKADASLRGTSVLLLGSSHNPYDEAKGRQAGADGSLTKPFDSQSLIDKVQDTLSRAPSREAPAPARAPVAVPVAVPPAHDRTQRVDDADIEEEYGEFTLERSPTPPPARPVAPPRAAPAPARPAAPVPSPRPSLIPGVNPAAVPPRRQPAVAPVAAEVRPRPLPSTPMAADAAARGGGGPMSRTLMGMPAAGMQARSGAASPIAPAPARPQPSPASVPTGPVSPVPSPFGTPAPEVEARPSARPGQAEPSINQRVNQRVNDALGQIAARGPEYEAIAKLSREIIEQVVWEVVPELAEVIIRQEVDRLASAKNKTT